MAHCELCGCELFLGQWIFPCTKPNQLGDRQHEVCKARFCEKCILDAMGKGFVCPRCKKHRDVPSSKVQLTEDNISD